MYNREYFAVEGRNISRFLTRLSDNKINIYKIETISDLKLLILVDKKDVPKIEELKTIYELKSEKEVGFNNYLNIVKKNSILIGLIIINFIFLYLISNYLFEIEIIDNNMETKEFVMKELNNNGINIFTKKKSFNEIETIKTKILKENKDKIEWLEIVESGVKYIVKVEERIINPVKESKYPTNIVAAKAGIVKKIISASGQVLVATNTYVQKGDILISGIIKLNEEEKSRIQAEGDVYAETWYKVTGEQSFHEQVDEELKNNKKGLKVQIFNKSYKLYKDYYTSSIKEKILLKSKVLPIYLSYDLVTEKNYKDVILTYEEALEKALNKARNQINQNLEGMEKIISENQLKVTVKDSKIIVDVLFTVYEKISVAERIEVENVSWKCKNCN